MSFVIFSACSPSPMPGVTELIPTLAPTMLGKRKIDLTSPSVFYWVIGTCDVRAYGLERSLDEGKTWTDMECPEDGKLRFRVKVDQEIHVWLRSRTKYAYTSTTKGKITFRVPPTAPLLTFVTASSSPRYSKIDPKLVYSMGYYTGEPSSEGRPFKVDLHLTGIAYDE